MIFFGEFSLVKNNNDDYHHAIMPHQHQHGALTCFDFVILLSFETQHRDKPVWKIRINYLEESSEILIRLLVTISLPVKIIYLENLMLEPMNCAMKMVA